MGNDLNKAEKHYLQLLRHLLQRLLSESESEVTQSCPTLCNPMDCSLPGFSVHGIFQAKILEWGAISFSKGSAQPRDQAGSLALQVDALPSKAPGKPGNGNR